MIFTDFTNPESIPPKTLIITLILGLMHLLIDLASGFIVAQARLVPNLTPTNLFAIGLTYNTFAFSLQPFIGYFIDITHKARAIGVSSLVIALISLPLASYMHPSAPILIGFANAMFHVAGGYITLNIKPLSATLAGLYVAPGALGLFLGLLAGKNSHVWQWPIIGGIILTLLIVIKTKLFLAPKIHSPHYYHPHMLAITLGLLIVIGIRVIIGDSLIFPWKSEMSLLVLLTLALVLGKSMGGWFADHCGWIKVTAIALIVSFPLLLTGTHWPAAGILGTLLFQFTMPVSLAAIAGMYPHYKAFAFGLTTLALSAGSLTSLGMPIPVTYPTKITVLLTLSLTLIVFCIKPLSNAFSVMIKQTGQSV